jgi:hypothetical protein
MMGFMSNDRAVNPTRVPLAACSTTLFGFVSMSAGREGGTFVMLIATEAVELPPAPSSAWMVIVCLLAKP